MEQPNFFHGANRRVTIGSPTKQCSNGRIVFPIKMPLTGESFVGMPDWVGTGYTAVSQNFTEVDPEVQQISDITLAFSNDKPAGELFQPPSAKVPGAELKGFKIKRTEDPDDPNVELHFKAFAPFTRDFWEWVGQMAGKEVYMAFPSTMAGTVKAVKQESLPEEIPDAEAEAFAGDSNPEEGPGSAEFEQQVRQSIGAPEPLSEAPRLMRHDDPEPGFRNGKDLAAYNAQKTEQESTKKRRRNLAAVN